MLMKESLTRIIRNNCYYINSVKMYKTNGRTKTWIKLKNNISIVSPSCMQPQFVVVI